MLISKIRNENNLTQKELAKKINVSECYISLIENGTRRPSPEVAKKLGKILGFDWTKFYEETDK